MNLEMDLALSYYKQIAILNEDHKIYLVQHQLSKKIYVQKILDVYNLSIYKRLVNNPITGTPSIIELFPKENQLIVIEEYITGTTLEDLITSRSYTSDNIFQYMIELCNILVQLHSMNPPIIHRDIKPTNIIITKFNHAVLLDFNAAKFYSTNGDKDTVLLGTKGYAAPEQYGFGASSPQTDIYALGVILKELIIACPSPDNISYQNICDKCIQLDPKQRYQTIHELVADLQKIRGYVNESLPKESLKLRDFILPGFRTKNPFKIAIASISYGIILWLSFTTEFENVTGASLIFERFICFLMMIFVVFFSTNYMNCQRYTPFLKKQKPFSKFILTILIDFAICFLLLFILVFVQEIFFS